MKQRPISINATEAEIKLSIEEIRKQNTVIVIAHRFSMVRDADFVIVIEEGKLIESGTPASLIESGGWFSEFSKITKEDAEIAEPEKEEDEEE